MFISDSVNMFTSDSVSIFTSDPASMFTSNLVSKVITWLTSSLMKLTGEHVVFSPEIRHLHVLGATSLGALGLF